MKNFNLLNYLLIILLISCSSDNEVVVPQQNLPPEAPTDLKGELTEENQIVLEWTDNSYNETGFIIERMEGTNQFIEVGKVGTDIAMFMDEDAQFSTTYTYRVYSYNSYGKSLTFSNQFTITIPEAQLPPLAPSDLVAELGEDNEIHLEWTDNSDNESGFRIERREGEDLFAEIGEVESGTNSFMDENTQLSTTYAYRVYSYNVYGNSFEYSNEVEITTPDPVPKVNGIYAIKSDFTGVETTKLILLDYENETQETVFDFSTSDNCESASIHRGLDSFSFVTSIGDGNTEAKLYVASLPLAGFMSFDLNSGPEIDYELIPVSEEVLYAIKQSYTSENIISKLVSLATMESEIIIMDLETNNNFNSLAFDVLSNTLYGVTSLGDGNEDCELYALDMSNNSFSYQVLSTKYNYEITISDTGQLFAVECDFEGGDTSKIYKLELTGNNEIVKTLIVDLQTTDNFTNLIFKDGILYGTTLIGDGNINSEIYAVDIQNQTFAFQFLTDVPGICFELMY